MLGTCIQIQVRTLTVTQHRCVRVCATGAGRRPRLACRCRSMAVRAAGAALRALVRERGAELGPGLVRPPLAGRVP